MIEYDIRPMIAEEDKYTFRQSSQISAQTGLIGYLRADMGTDGNGFYSSWTDWRKDLKTEAFLAEIDEIINSLREEGDLLHNRKNLARYCLSHPGCRMDMKRACYGIRVDTERHTYLFRLNPNEGDYDLFCYCYVKEWLNAHIQHARKGVQFITPDYEDLFTLEDGDMIRICTPSGETTDKVVRFIDPYHLEVSGVLGSNLYHICEFSERMEQAGNHVIPLRSSLPEKCFVYIESEDKIGIVERGETGYKPAGVKPEKGVSKQKGVEYLNDAQGITKAQAAAMKAGSMFGWATKAADPAFYTSEGVVRKDLRRSERACCEAESRYGILAPETKTAKDEYENLKHGR